KEREIERKLTSPVSVDFKDTPLSQALSDLHEWSSINIVPDSAALQEEGIALDRPVTLKLEAVSLKSALNILLKQVHLTYIIQDEALQVTTEKNAKGKLVQRTFPVADLVIPVDNFVVPASANLMQTLDRSMAMPFQTGGVSPYLGKRAMTEGTAVSSPGGGIPGTSPLSANAPTPGTTVGHNQTIHDLLMTLVKNTVAPGTWTDVGGPGTIDYFPLGMGLVINQTPDVLDQVAELLEQLRVLQDLSVAVEVRMISLEETFFERIGLDFDINIKTNNTRFEPQLITQNFKPPGFINDFQPNRFVSGLTPAGTFTSDLDIPINSSSFNFAIPPFGNFPNIPGADGGLSLGLAFLSDIQVFMFMEAAQGSRRTNTMQAPKLTLFNGQTSTISVSDFQFFVLNVIPAQTGGGQIVFFPMNTPIFLGTNLTIQAIVSADRRFVRLNLSPRLTNLASATVPLFPITMFITPIFESGAQGQPIPFTQFIQQPSLSVVEVNTTVAVPDGGTVLLGGLKLLNEGRNEFGPPILSKIPYINRLFKNVGYGRDTTSLMLMVTPRIIINREEEERVLGGGGASALGGGEAGGGGALGGGGAGAPGGGLGGGGAGAAAMGPGGR
ncbi:MAG TPA: hypothetical protein VKI65_07230, partial [Gemmataceae bacterium]|nr:hypothetical protein [Gemmataceae bacterium]